MTLSGNCQPLRYLRMASSQLGGIWRIFHLSQCCPDEWHAADWHDHVAGGKHRRRRNRRFFLVSISDHFRENLVQESFGLKSIQQKICAEFFLIDTCYCNVDGCPELTPDEPRVGEKHKSHTKGFYSRPCVRWDKRRWLNWRAELL